MLLLIVIGVIILVSLLYMNSSNDSDNDEYIEKKAEEKYQYLLKQKEKGIDIEAEILRQIKVHNGNIACLQDINNNIYNQTYMDSSDKRYHRKNQLELREMLTELKILNKVYKKIS